MKEFREMGHPRGQRIARALVLSEENFLCILTCSGSKLGENSRKNYFYQPTAAIAGGIDSNGDAI